MKHNAFAYNGQGKLGNWVAYTRAGVQCFRAYQPIVTNPRTQRQVMSREKLKLASLLSRALAEVLRLSYADKSNANVSARNIFTREIIPTSKGVITGALPSALVVDYEKLPVAVGVVPNMNFDEPDLDTPLTVSVGITETYKDAAMHTDASGADCAVEVVLAAYNKTLGESVYKTLLAYDERGWQDWTTTQHPKIELVAPLRWQGTQVELYAFMKQFPFANNGISTATKPHRIPGRTSKSVYLGAGTIA